MNTDGKLSFAKEPYRLNQVLSAAGVVDTTNNVFVGDERVIPPAIIEEQSINRASTERRPNTLRRIGDLLDIEA